MWKKNEHVRGSEVGDGFEGEQQEFVVNSQVYREFPTKLHHVNMYIYLIN